MATLTDPRGTGGNSNHSPRKRQSGPKLKKSHLGEAVKGPAAWVLVFAIFVAVMGSSLGLSNALQDSSWLPRGVLVVAFTLIPPALFRRYPRLAPFAPVGALFGWIAGITLTFFPATAYLGLIPSIDTFGNFGTHAQQAAQTILVSNTPVPVDLGITFAVCVGLGFVALMVDTLAVTLALPAWSGLALVLLLLPAAFTAQDSIGTVGFVGAIGGYLLILGCCSWYAPGGKLRSGGNVAPSGMLLRGFGLGTALLLIIAIVPGVIPGFTSGSFPQGSRFGVGGVGGLDPMISLGNNLRSQSSSINVEYETTSKTALYLKMSTLEDFSGKTWKPSELPNGLLGGLAEVHTALSSDEALSQNSKIYTQIDSLNLDSPWLPAPSTVTGVTGLTGNWAWNPSTATIHANGGTSTLKQKYTVDSTSTDLTIEILRNATGPVPKELDSVFSKLPNDVPKIVSETEAKIVQGATTPYDKALAIQDYLRSPQFTYSTKTPVEKGYDGSGMGVLAKFLEVKSGYCIHFSAAMAVMAREAGIPSRIAVGYAPGNANDTTEGIKFMSDAGESLTTNGFSATGQNAHAWPELYFTGVGWVPFEPTPSRGVVPSYAEAPSSGGSATQAPSDTLNGSNRNPSSSASAAASAAPTASATASSQGATAASTAHKPGSFLPLWIFIGLLIVSIPALLRMMQRRRRLAALQSSPASASGPEIAWQELMALAADYGLRTVATQTPREQAAQINARLGTESENDVAMLLADYQEQVFGPTPAASVAAVVEHYNLARALERSNAHFAATASLWQRLRAILLPASLFNRKN